MSKKRKDKQNFQERRRNHRHIQESLFPELAPGPVKPLNFYQRNARWFMGFFLVVGDLIGLFLSFNLAVLGLDAILQTRVEIPVTILLSAFLVVLLFYYFNGLYQAVGLSPVEELKNLVRATTFSFLFLSMLSYAFLAANVNSRYLLIAWWFFSLFIIQLYRWITRIIFRKVGLWGEPVAIIGKGPIGREIYRFLNYNLHLGMQPYLWISGQDELDIAVLDSINCSRISTAILVTPEIPEEVQQSFIYNQRFGFHRRSGEGNIQHIILISSLSWVGSLGILVHDLEGFMGLEVRQNLLLKANQRLKRLIDISLCCLFGIVAFPLILLIALAIAVDSTGPVIYKQERIGYQGRIFRMWKFRTMYENSKNILDEFLDANPQAREEWSSRRKLKNDPRITHVGKFLRKLSLDELPQFFNILRGEMSLVGPRPFNFEMNKDFVFPLYRRVRPGLTGMWQVLGRNRLTVKERIQLDEYYIRNWSTWLDIYIILRTFWVIITQDGAY